MEVTRDEAKLAYKVYKRAFRYKMEANDYNLGVKAWIKKMKSELEHHKDYYVGQINNVSVSFLKELNQLSDFTISKL